MAEALSRGVSLRKRFAAVGAALGIGAAGLTGGIPSPARSETVPNQIVSQGQGTLEPPSTPIVKLSAEPTTPLSPKPTMVPTPGQPATPEPPPQPAPIETPSPTPEPTPPPAPLPTPEPSPTPTGSIGTAVSKTPDAFPTPTPEPTQNQ